MRNATAAAKRDGSGEREAAAASSSAREGAAAAWKRGEQVAVKRLSTRCVAEAKRAGIPVPT